MTMELFGFDEMFKFLKLRVTDSPAPCPGSQGDQGFRFLVSYTASDDPLLAEAQCQTCQARDVGRGLSHAPVQAPGGLTAGGCSTQPKPKGHGERKRVPVLRARARARTAPSVLAQGAGHLVLSPSVSERLDPGQHRAGGPCVFAESGNHPHGGNGVTPSRAPAGLAAVTDRRLNISWSS